MLGKELQEQEFLVPTKRCVLGSNTETNITTPRTYHGYILAGSHTTFETDPTLQNSVLFDGVLCVGNLATIHTPSITGCADSSRLCLRGTTITGSWANVFGEDDSKDVSKLESKTDIAQEGVVIGGIQSYFTTNNRQSGVVIMGAATSLSIKGNTGVVISGTFAETTSSRYFDENGYDITGTVDASGKQLGNHKVSTGVEGPGVFIRGTCIDGNVKNSLIQGSTQSSLPTLLSKYFKLKSDFNLLDSSGDYIFRNGQFVAK